MARIPKEQPMPNDPKSRKPLGLLSEEDVKSLIIQSIKTGPIKIYSFYNGKYRVRYLRGDSFAEGNFLFYFDKNGVQRVTTWPAVSSSLFTNYWLMYAYAIRKGMKCEELKQ